MPSNEVFNEILKKSFKIVEESISKRDNYTPVETITGGLKDVLAMMDQRKKNEAAKVAAPMRPSNTRTVPTPQELKRSITPQRTPTPSNYQTATRVRSHQDNNEASYGEYARDQHKMRNAKIFLGMLFLGVLLVVCVAVGLYQ